MKTLAWTPAQNEVSAEFNLEDEVIFSSATAKIDKRVSMITALLSGADYAGRGIGFEIRSMTQDTLAVFEPGQPIRAYRSILRSLIEAAGHLDYHAKNIATASATLIKIDVKRVYEQGLADGALAAKKCFEETGAFGLLELPVEGRSADTGAGTAAIPAEAVPSAEAPSA
jgi:hypothetical protein